MVVNLADQKPKPSETHSSTFLQDSDSDSKIELRSTHTSPETTTSDESDGTLVDTSQTADTSDTTKRRPRWLIRKPERRHSGDLEELDKQEPKPYRYVLRRV